MDEKYIQTAIATPQNGSMGLSGTVTSQKIINIAELLRVWKHFGVFLANSGRMLL